jgi:hypothetical protein
MALQSKQLKEVRMMEFLFVMELNYSTLYLYNTKRDTAQQRKYYLG